MELIDVTATEGHRFPRLDGKQNKDPEGRGRVLRCSECDTLLRPGQPHTAFEPTPHVSLDALTVIEALEAE